MADLTNLIEDIRTTLAFSASASPDKLSGYAKEYAEECTKLNGRLKQCLPYLRGGNIAEAVRLAEVPPNVIEVFRLLDFESRQDWHEVCDGLRLDVAPPLAVEVFQELNDAYLQITSLESLLKWHRLYALNGSPLRDRLAVLRSIAKADPINLHWQTDQETFEKVRIKELGKEVADALAQKDMFRLQELYRELTAPGWQIPPPTEYRQKICTAVLEKYADELMKHFSAFDYSAAAAVYQSMEQVLFANRMAMPAAIEQSIRAAVQWVQETAREEMHLEQFQKETAHLRDALEVYTPRESLENLYYALQNTATHVNRAIPSELESHYHSRINYLTRIEQRRFYVVVTAFAGSILLLASIIIYALAERSFSEQVAQALETLSKIKTENRIDDIDQALKAVKPNIAKLPKVEPVIARLRQMLEKDNERSEKFKHYCNQAYLLMEQKPDMDGLRAAKSSIDQADNLKRTAQDITQFADLRSQYDSLFREEQNKADRDFSDQFVKYRLDFNALSRPANAEYPPDGLLDQLNMLTESVKNLLTQHPNISRQQRQEGSNLLTSIANMQQSIQQTMAESERFRQMISRRHNLLSSKGALQDFSTKFPNHPAADDIKDLLKNFDSIQDAADSLQALCRNFPYAGSNRQNQYNEVAAKIENLEMVFPSAELAETLATMKPIDDTTFRTTKGRLATIAERDLYPWVDVQENWYYLTTKPAIGADGRISNARDLAYVTSPTSEPKKEGLSLNNGERNKDNYDFLQSTFSRDALKQLDKIIADPTGQENAAETIGGLLVNLKEASGIDPILKIILLHLFISDYSKVDPIFAENFKRVTELIKDGDVNLNSNWMDVKPGRELDNTSTQRRRANAVLNQLTDTADLKTLVEKTKKETNEFHRKMFEANPKFEFVGLLTIQDRKWRYSPTVTTLPSESGKLFVLQMSGEKVRAVPVGTVSAGVTSLADRINVLQCSPVFFMN